MMAHRFLISTDLDGTLIDHHDYSFDAALPALKRCAELSVPVILNTSKTFAEALSIQVQLGLKSPLIVENGSALFWCNSSDCRDPAAPSRLDHNMQSGFSRQLFGVERAEILSFIDAMRSEYNWRFEGFNDWSIEQISENTGLSLEAAARANSKQFSEPFLWHDSESALQKMRSLARAEGLEVLKGGRFYHLQGNTDKAKPLKWLLQHPRILFDDVADVESQVGYTLIALGDNHNDIAMLNAADIAVCVRSPVAEYPDISSAKKIIRTQGYGPVGWAEAVRSIL